MIKPAYPREFCLPPLFSDTSPWNQKVDTVISEPENQRTMLVSFDILREFSWTVLSEKRAELVKKLACRKDIDPLRRDIFRRQDSLAISAEGVDRGGLPPLQIGFDDYSFPIFPVRYDGSNRIVTTVPMKTYLGESWAPFYSPQHQVGEAYFADDVPVPLGPFRPAGPAGPDSDGSLILYDTATKEEFDFWQVTTSDDPKKRGGGVEGNAILEAGSVSRFDAKGLGARIPPDPLGSSRASGLPYLGGLLVPEDFKSGPDAVIKHALAFTFPRSRYLPFPVQGDPPDFIYPAVRSETTYFIQNPYALAAGMRIRLKDTIKNAAGDELPKSRWREVLPPAVSIFLTALHDYGAYLVDGAAGFGIAAEDIHTATIDANVVQKLFGKDQQAKIGDEETPWQGLLGVINDYLSYRLFEEAKVVADKGLPFGYLKKKSPATSDKDKYEFWTNFEVVTPLTEPPPTPVPVPAPN